MSNSTENKFIETVQQGYDFAGPHLVLGAAVLNKKTYTSLLVKMPLATINRHGLISGATGTGKTKTMQQFAESLSDNGVSVLLMDVKGDVSGLAMPGNDHPKIQDRHAQIGMPWRAASYPVELLTISNENGTRLRATVSEFGPVLFSKILELNENQQGAVSIVFKYCDDKGWLLLDIKDFRAALLYLTNEGKSELNSYGGISSTTAGVIMRKLLELEQQGGDLFFGELSFEVEDLLQKDDKGRGSVNILRLCDIQDKPRLFSSFMLCLLAEVYAKFPEVGDKGTPKLVIIIDEAHLVFREATKALMDQLETVIKLIRSKGVGIYFCTQVPSDIPEVILSQLGAKFQHSLRAFTAKDRKDIRLVAQNYPETEFYDTEKQLTELGIGEAFITLLNEKGIPTPLVHTLLCAPQSRMDVLTTGEIDTLVSKSQLAAEYNKQIDRESAFEILKKKLDTPADTESNDSNRTEKETTVADTISSVTKSPLFRTVAREITRGLMGALFGRTTTRRRRRY